MLRFASHVDWKHMKLALLDRLNQLAAETHQIIYIYSGYRSDAYSQHVGGFRGDPHTHGIAADAKVGGPNGKSIGTFYSAKTLAKYGLRSGNQPNFYKGKTDPDHVDMIGFGYDRQGSPTGKTKDAQYANRAAAAVEAPVGTQTPQAQDVPQDVIGTQPSPPQTGAATELTAPPSGLLPGTVAGNQSPIGASNYWKKVLDQPSVSPETQSYASLYNT
jgi:hypothetical protein